MDNKKYVNVPISFLLAIDSILQDTRDFTCILADKYKEKEQESGAYKTIIGNLENSNSKLQSFILNQIEIKGIEKTSEELQESISQKDADLIRQKEALAEKDAEITALQAEIASLKSQLADKEKNKRAGTEAAATKRLRQWKAALPFMFKVRDQCLAEGPKERTKEQLKRMFEKAGYLDLSIEQLEEFRRNLPKGHYQDHTGAPKQ